MHLSTVFTVMRIQLYFRSFSSRWGAATARTDSSRGWYGIFRQRLTEYAATMWISSRTRRIRRKHHLTMYIGCSRGRGRSRGNSSGGRLKRSPIPTPGAISNTIRRTQGQRTASVPVVWCSMRYTNTRTIIGSMSCARLSVKSSTRGNFTSRQTAMSARAFSMRKNGSHTIF